MGVVVENDDVQLATLITDRAREPELRRALLAMIDRLESELIRLVEQESLLEKNPETYFQAIDLASAEVCEAAAAGGFWTTNPTGRPWIEFFERLNAMHLRLADYHFNSNRTMLPTYLALCHFGTTAWDAQRLDALNAVLTCVYVKDPNRENSLVPLPNYLYSTLGSSERFFPNTGQPINFAQLSSAVWASSLFLHMDAYFASRLHSHSAFLHFETLLVMEVIRSTGRVSPDDLTRLYVPRGKWASELLPTAGSEKRTSTVFLAALASERVLWAPLAHGIGGTVEIATAILERMKDAR